MTITHGVAQTTLVLLLLSAAATSAWGQEIAGSFDQLRVLVKPGDTITVTDAAGVETKGRIAELSPASLALLVKGARRELGSADISVIRQRRSDSLANGAWSGFGVGAALGVAAGLMLESEYEDDSAGALVFFGGLIYGGIGAGIGAGFDAMYQSEQVIYARARTTARSVAVSPILGTRKGLMVSLAF